jgi:hypothetical protein
LLNLADGDLAHCRLDSGSSRPSAAVSLLRASATGKSGAIALRKVRLPLLVGLPARADSSSARLSKSHHHLAEFEMVVHEHA